MHVFFYGLFMDEALLARKGIRPTNVATGSVDGLALRIGERATLERSAGARTYGLVMTIDDTKVQELYTEESVADYVAETVVVELADGGKVQAVCYILPADKITGTNKGYAASLRELATRLGFPDAYLEQIRKATI